MTENIIKKDNKNVIVKIKELFKTNAILVIFIILFAIISIAKPETFLTLRNLINILRQVSVVGIIACGMTMVLISGNMDLSVGSTYSLCLVIPILLEPYGIVLQITVAILAGITVGFINGVLVGKLNANSFIITLGMLSIVQGIAYIISGGKYLQANLETVLLIVGRKNFFNIPVSVYALFIIAIISYLILSKTTFGRKVYLTGSNPFAAYASGINTGNIKMLTFVITGLFCSMGGILSMSLIGTAQPGAGANMEFDVLTAVILGGTSLFGGKGSIFNTIIGVLLLGIVGNSMIMIGIPFSFQLVAKGSILMAAVYYDNLINRAQR